jgi:hypothetical protein
MSDQRLQVFAGFDRPDLNRKQSQIRDSMQRDKTLKIVEFKSVLTFFSYRGF